MKFIYTVLLRLTSNYWKLQYQIFGLCKQTFDINLPINGTAALPY